MEWGEVRYFKLGNMRFLEVIILGVFMKGRGVVIFIVFGILLMYYVCIKL